MWIKTSIDYAVSARTVLFTLTNGKKKQSLLYIPKINVFLTIMSVFKNNNWDLHTGVPTCDWAPTNCIASPDSETLDDICADNCSGGSCGYNITVIDFHIF